MSVVTVLEADVAAGQAEALLAAYQQAVEHLDTGIEETFLLRGTQDPGRWQIVTVWSSRAALDAMRQSGATPRGVLIFREAGAEPSLTVFEMAARGKAVSDRIDK